MLFRSKRVEALTENSPSTNSLIFPEVYLETGDRKARIQAIHQAMKEYIDPARGDVFDRAMHGFIYLERTTEYGRTRKGIVAAIDLESYDWKPDTTALIRATEATIVDRIPPRMEIRRGAPLELPHIMLLVNDPNKTLVEQTGTQAKKMKPHYDTKLEPKAGHITGWEVSSDKAFSDMATALSNLDRKSVV